jgi:hypothetical protein
LQTAVTNEQTNQFTDIHLPEEPLNGFVVRVCGDNQRFQRLFTAGQDVEVLLNDVK